MKTRVLFTVAAGLFPFIICAPLITNALTLAGALLVYAVIAYIVCLLVKERLSRSAKLLALLSGWVFYVLIGVVYFTIRGTAAPSVGTVLILAPTVIIGLLTGWAIYALRPVWLKISFAVLVAAAVFFLWCDGEKAYMNRVYYGSWQGNVNEPVASLPDFIDIDGNAVAFDVNEDRYSVIQLFRLGYGYSRLDVEKFSKPAFEKYGDDPRVKFLVAGISSDNDYEGIVSGKDIVKMGLPYAQSSDSEELKNMLLYDIHDMGGIVIIRGGTIIFRGDPAMCLSELDKLLE